VGDKSGKDKKSEEKLEEKIKLLRKKYEESKIKYEKMSKEQEKQWKNKI